MNAETMKAMITPCLSVVFIAGGAWVTLDAVAQQNGDLSDRVEIVEDKVAQQQVIEVKVEQVEKRLERLESAIDKMIEIQQQNAQNVAAICASTGANCR